MSAAKYLTDAYYIYNKFSSRHRQDNTKQEQ